MRPLRLDSEELAMKIRHIGNVVIVPFNLKHPYGWEGEFACGAPRLALLKQFRDNKLGPEWQAWHAPWSGPAEKIESSDVEWGNLSDSKL